MTQQTESPNIRPDQIRRNDKEDCMEIWKVFFQQYFIDNPVMDIDAQWKTIKRAFPTWDVHEKNKMLFCKNLCIYFHERFQEWRLHDDSTLRTEDLCSLDPTKHGGVDLAKKNASLYYRDDFVRPAWK